jgi:hypothetical protein
MNIITTNFASAVERRGESTGFGRWGGAIAFDSNPSAPWHFNHTTQPSGNVFDFYSVAVHELAHALGFGESDFDGLSAWETRVSGSSFVGGNAMAQNGGNPVPLSPDGGHWANGTASVVYGGSTSQEVAMDPDLQNGTRKRFTELDAAAMKDIGWEVISLPGLNGDYNNNGVLDAADYVVWRNRLNQSVVIPNDSTPGTVTAADYTVWRAGFGKGQGAGSNVALAPTPEPASAVLALLGAAACFTVRREKPRGQTMRSAVAG